MSYPRCVLTDDVCVASLTATQSEMDTDGWDIDSQGAVIITGGAAGFRFWNGTDADMGGSLISLTDYVLLNGDGTGQLEITNLDFDYDAPATGTATYVTATDSTVSGTGPDMDATDASNVDGGGNVRWDFGLSSSSTSQSSHSSSSTQSDASSLSSLSSSSSSSLSSLSTSSTLSTLSSSSTSTQSDVSSLSTLSSRSSSSSSIIFHLPVALTFVGGGSVSGTVNSARKIDGVYVSANELIQNPGLFFWFQFDEVPNTTDYDVEITGRFSDTAGNGNAIEVVAYNFSLSQWVVIAPNAFTDNATDQTKQFGIPDSSSYISIATGQLRIGVRSNNTGSLGNNFRLDRIILVEAISSSSSLSSSSLSSSSSTSQSSQTSLSSSTSSQSTQSSLSSSTSTSQSSLSSLSSSTSTQSSQSSQSSTSSVEEVVIPSGYDTCSGETVTSATLSDVPNLSCTVTVPTGGAHVAAFFSAEVQTNAVEAAFFAVSINSVDSTEIQRYFSAANTPGSISVVFRTSSPLAAGTYTVKGRMRATNGTTTVTVNDGTLVAIALATTLGNDIPSGTAAGDDTTTSATLEDIGGITANVTLTHRNHIVAFLASSIQASVPARTVTIGLDINGEQATSDRYLSSANTRGAAGAVLQTLSTAVAGTRTSKGIWATNGGTATGSFQLVTFGLEDGVDSIDSAFAETGPHSTTSAALTDITSGISIVLNHAAYVFAAIAIEAEPSLANTLGEFALNINGTDGPIFGRFLATVGREGNITIYRRSAVKVGPGTVTVKGRYRTDKGTLTVNDTHLFVMALESTPLIFDSSSSSSQSSRSSSSSTQSSLSTTSSSQSNATSSTSTQSSLSSSTSTQSSLSSQSSSTSTQSSQSSLSSSTSTQSDQTSQSTQSSQSTSTSQSSLSSSSTSTASTLSSQSSITSSTSTSQTSLSSSTSTSQSSGSSSSTGASLSELSSSTTSTLSTASSSSSSQSSLSSRSSSRSSSSSIIFHLPSTYTLIHGTVDGGTLNDTRQPNNVFLRIREEDGVTPGIFAEFNFLEVPDTVDYDLMFRGYYDGDDPLMRLSIYNNLSTGYDDLLSLPFGQAGPTTYRVALPDDAAYLDGAGTLRIAFYSPEPGHPDHSLFVDWLELVEAISSSSSTSTSQTSLSSSSTSLSSQTSLSSSTSTASSQTSQSTSTSQTSLSSTTSTLSTQSSLSTSTSTLSSQSSSTSTLSSLSSSTSTQSDVSSSTSTLSSQTTSLSSQTTSQTSQSSQTSSLSSSSTSTQSSASSSSSSETSLSSSQSTSQSSQSSTSVSSSSSTSGVGLFPAGATAVQICPSNATSVRRCASAATVTAVRPMGATAAMPTV